MSTAKVKASSRETATVELPSVKGSCVVVYKNLLVAEQEEMAKLYPDPTKLEPMDRFKYMIDTLTRAVKEWNLTDDNDVPLSTKEDKSFGVVSLPDVYKMLEVCTGRKMLDDNNMPLTPEALKEGKKVTTATETQ